MTIKGKYPEPESNEGLIAMLTLIGFAVFAGILFGLSTGV
jgi:hypothetical protein